jgi:hypothetical protein
MGTLETSDTALMRAGIEAHRDHHTAGNPQFIIMHARCHHDKELKCTSGHQGCGWCACL